ncbi:MAG: D-alanyl-D-alanine carboxypeptidase family protein [Pyrinomonadaceae bacterium]
MNFQRIHPAAYAIFLALAIIAWFFATTGRSQTRDSNKQTTSSIKRVLKPIASATSSAENKGLASSILATAASRNSILINELNWTFGGKQQHGWYLYSALIGRLLNASDDGASAPFAASLIKWQRDTGLTANGILAEDSLYAMVGYWQQNRLKERDVANAADLIVAPVSDFYDPSRPAELRQVERQTYFAYKAMLAAAAADSSLNLRLDNEGSLAPEQKYLKIVSAFRSPQYQEQLRKQSPNAGRAGLAVTSPHFTGRALDLYVGGEPVETRDSNRAIQVQTPVYRWLVRNADRFGFRPYYYEPWHWEYVGKQ